MKRFSLFLLPLLLIFTACQKSLDHKKSPVSLNEFMKAYPGLEAIAEEKSALDVQADELQPTKNEDLVELTQVLAKLYTVYTEALPPLIEREKDVRKEAINSWKERSIDSVANADAITQKALDDLEINALRDLLASKVKANEVAQERFVTLQLMAEQLKSQAEELIERATKASPQTKDAIEKDHEAFNTFATFIQDEQRWVASHPPAKDKEEIIEQWKMEHPHTPFLEQALTSYEQTYR